MAGNLFKIFFSSGSYLMEMAGNSFLRMMHKSTEFPYKIANQCHNICNRLEDYIYFGKPKLESSKEVKNTNSDKQRIKVNLDSFTLANQNIFQNNKDGKERRGVAKHHECDGYQKEKGSLTRNCENLYQLDECLSLKWSNTWNDILPNAVIPHFARARYSPKSSYCTAYPNRLHPRYGNLFSEYDYNFIKTNQYLHTNTQHTNYTTMGSNKSLTAIPPMKETGNLAINSVYKDVCNIASRLLFVLRSCIHYNTILYNAKPNQNSSRLENSENIYSIKNAYNLKEKYYSNKHLILKKRQSSKSGNEMKEKCHSYTAMDLNKDISFKSCPINNATKNVPGRFMEPNGKQLKPNKRSMKFNNTPCSNTANFKYLSQLLENFKMKSYINLLTTLKQTQLSLSATKFNTGTVSQTTNLQPLQCENVGTDVNEIKEHIRLLKINRKMFDLTENNIQILKLIDPDEIREQTNILEINRKAFENMEKIIRKIKIIKKHKKIPTISHKKSPNMDDDKPNSKHLESFNDAVYHKKDIAHEKSTCINLKCCNNQSEASNQENEYVQKCICNNDARKKKPSNNETTTVKSIIEVVKDIQKEVLVLLCKQLIQNKKKEIAKNAVPLIKSNKDVQISNKYLNNAEDCRIVNLQNKSIPVIVEKSANTRAANQNVLILEQTQLQYKYQKRLPKFKKFLEDVAIMQNKTLALLCKELLEIPITNQHKDSKNMSSIDMVVEDNSKVIDKATIAAKGNKYIKVENNPGVNTQVAVNSTSTSQDTKSNKPILQELPKMRNIHNKLPTYFKKHSGTLILPETTFWNAFPKQPLNIDSYEFAKQMKMKNRFSKKYRFETKEVKSMLGDKIKITRLISENDG